MPFLQNLVLPLQRMLLAHQARTLNRRLEVWPFYATAAAKIVPIPSYVDVAGAGSAFAFIDGGITLPSTLMRPNEPLLHLVYFYIVNVAAVSAFVILTGWVLLAARLLMIFQQKR